MDLNNNAQDGQQGDSSSASRQTQQARQGVRADDQTATPQQDLQQDLESAQQKINELTEVSKRALADLSNYRKRVEEERTQFAKFANVSLILEILPVIDNFKRAFAHIPQELKGNEWVKGVMQIEKQLLDIFQKQGVREIDVSIGETLDTNKHEAVTSGDGPQDEILEVFENGYTLGEKVIRPARVKVGNGA